jgi:hypothetical protein
MRILIYLLVILFLGCESSKSSWQSFEVDDRDPFDVQLKGVIVETESGLQDTVRADLKLASPYGCSISFTSATLRADTLRVVIHEATTTCNNEFRILMVDGRYQIQCKTSIPIDSFETEEETIAQEDSSSLKLNTSKFEKGMTIHGNITFIGRRSKVLGGDKISITGNFAAEIK